MIRNDTEFLWLCKQSYPHFLKRYVCTHIYTWKDKKSDRALEQNGSVCLDEKWEVRGSHKSTPHHQCLLNVLIFKWKAYWLACLFHGTDYLVLSNNWLTNRSIRTVSILTVKMQHLLKSEAIDLWISYINKLYLRCIFTDPVCWFPIKQWKFGLTKCSLAL